MQKALGAIGAHILKPQWFKLGLMSNGLCLKFIINIHVRACTERSTEGKKTA